MGVGSDLAEPIMLEHGLHILQLRDKPDVIVVKQLGFADGAFPQQLAILCSVRRQCSAV